MLPLCRYASGTVPTDGVDLLTDAVGRLSGPPHQFFKLGDVTFDLDNIGCDAFRALSSTFRAAHCFVCRTCAS
jgi:hypothetical protein